MATTPHYELPLYHNEPANLEGKYNQAMRIIDENLGTGGSGNNNLINNSDLSDPSKLLKTDGWVVDDKKYNGMTVLKCNQVIPGFTQNCYVQEGKIYTYSVNIKTEGGAHVFLRVNGLAGISTLPALCDPSSKLAVDSNSNTEWTRYSITFKATSDGYASPRVELGNAGHMVYVCGPKLEFGTKANDWSPSQQDLAETNSKIALITKQTQTSIETIVKKQTEVLKSDVVAAQTAAAAAQAAHNSALQQLEDLKLKQNTDSAAIAAAQEALRKAQEAVEDAKRQLLIVQSRVSNVETTVTQNSEAIEHKATKEEVEVIRQSVNGAVSSSDVNARDLAQFMQLVEKQKKELQSQIDGSITTWFNDNEPLNSNYPASDWSTTALKNQHLGDLYYDTTTGYCYRYQVKNQQYSWQKITDSDVTKALADAKLAKDTADGKRRVFVVTPKPPYEIGDLWSQGATGDIMRCKITKTAQQSFDNNDWEKASKYTDDSATTELAKRVAKNETSIKQTADKISLTATKTELQSAIDSIKTNGQNLLLNTDLVLEIDKEHPASTSWTNIIKLSETANLKPGEQLTLSVGAKADTDKFGQCNITITFAGTPEQSYAAIYTPQQGIPVDKRISTTFTVPNNNFTDVIITLNVQDVQPSQPFGTIALSYPKLERGDHATDWTISPNDLVSKCDMRAMFNITSEQVASEVMAKILNGKEYQELSTQINQTAKQIQLTANSVDQLQNQLQTWLRFDVEGLTIGQKNSEFTTRIDDKQLAFFSGSNRIAYASADSFNAPVMNVNDTLKLGDRWAFVVLPDGSLNLKWIG